MRVYLAGPDVFRPDVETWAATARAQCVQAGHEALLPLDGVETTAAGIARANFALIRSADAVAANLDPFRGAEPDSGTCVEVGYALALGKPVVGYVTVGGTTVDRYARVSGSKPERRDGRPVDVHGWHIEDFDLPLNLMLAVPARIIVGGLPEALAALTAQP